MVIELDPTGVAGVPETVKVIAHTAASTSITVVRGWDDSTARSHLAGTIWRHGPVSSDYVAPQFYVGRFPNLQAAIDAAFDASGGLGALVDLGGDLITTAELVIPSSVVVARGTIKLANGADSFLLETEDFGALTGGATSGGVSQFALRDLILDCNKDNNTFAEPAVRIYGYDYALERVRIRGSSDIGLWTEWCSSAEDPGPDSMEASLIDVKVHDCAGDGIVNHGPHDSSWLQVISFHNGGKGIDVDADGGALKASHVHAWGNSGVSWHIKAQVLASNCEAEGGGGAAQVVIDANDVQWMGGQIYAAGGSEVGIQLGDTNAVVGVAVKTKVLNCIDGAVNYANDGGGNDLDLLIYHSPATPVFAGSRNGGTAVRSKVAGSGTGGNEILWPHSIITGGGIRVFDGDVVLDDDKGFKWADGKTIYNDTGNDRLRTDEDFLFNGDVVIGSGKTLELFGDQPVDAAGNDSAGSGYRALRVPNV